MFRWIIIFSLMLVFGNVQAHQPDLSSTILSEVGENKWVLQVRAALTGYEYAIHYNFGEDSYKTPEEFQALVVQHIQDNISILFDENTKVSLKNGIVKLGHETNAIFEVEGMPENFKNVKFKNSTFKDISRNQSALIFLKKGIKQKQFVLSNANDHTAQLEVKDGHFVSIAANTETIAMTTPKSYYGISLFGVIGLIGFLIFRSKKVAA